MDVSLDFSPVTTIGDKAPSRMKWFVLFTTISAVLQRSDAPAKMCDLLESQSTETEVYLNVCGLNEILHKDMKLLRSVQKLYLQENNLQNIEPHVFSDNKNLTFLYLGGNANLYTPEDGCFLVSDSIKVLNLSDTNVCAIKPSLMECMPKLHLLILIGVPGCSQTKRLAKEANAGYRVICGGEGFEDPGYENISICRGRQWPGASTPRPPYSTPGVAGASDDSSRQNANLPNGNDSPPTTPSRGATSLPGAAAVCSFALLALGLSL